MPEGVQGIFGLAFLVHHAGGVHDRREVAKHILVVVDRPVEVANTRPHSPFGQASFHSFNVRVHVRGKRDRRALDDPIWAPISL